MIAAICLSVVLTGSAAPVPKAGPPRLIAVTSHKDGLWGIYVVHPDIGESKRLTDPNVAAYGPTWAPDGKRIAFISSRGGSAEIWTMKADGTDVERLTKKQGSCGNHRWSPDGKQIAFMLGEGGKDLMHIVDVATGKVTQLTDGSFPHGEVAWAPDGKRLSYLHGATGAIHTMKTDGTDDQKLTGPLNARNAAWAPDGKRIAFAAYQSEPPSGWHVFTIGADGTDKKQLSTVANTYGDVCPQWSPDGNLIAFTAMEDGVLQVGVVSAAGGEAKIITSGPHAHHYPRWSPDGKSLSYLHTEKGQRGKLMVSDPDGKNAKVLLTHVGSPVEWQPK